MIYKHEDEVDGNGDCDLCFMVADHEKNYMEEMLCFTVEPVVKNIILPTS